MFTDSSRFVGSGDLRRLYTASCTINGLESLYKRVIELEEKLDGLTALRNGGSTRGAQEVMTVAHTALRRGWEVTGSLEDCRSCSLTAQVHLSNSEHMRTNLNKKRKSRNECHKSRHFASVQNAKK